MTDNASPDPQDLTHFLQDWTSLWREEMLAHAADPASIEMWRTAISLWARAALIPPSAAGRGREQPEGRTARGRGTEGGRGTGGGAGTAPRPDAARPAGATAPAVAPDARDAAIERLMARIDALEARLARLEQPPGAGKPARPAARRVAAGTGGKKGSATG